MGISEHIRRWKTIYVGDFIETAPWTRTYDDKTLRINSGNTPGYSPLCQLSLQ